MQDTIDREITVRAPKERVFNAIVDPAQIVNWFPDGIEGKIEPGERPIFDFGTYGKVQIYVVAVEPHDYFAYRWASAGADGDAGDALTDPSTLVEFRLSEGPDGTTVKLTESGFASLPAAVMKKSLSDNSEGWDHMMARLAKLINES
jgi:uncharacterized protein YndB with AHSA1/START domain